MCSHVYNKDCPWSAMHTVSSVGRYYLSVTDRSSVRVPSVHDDLCIILSIESVIQNCPVARLVQPSIDLACDIMLSRYLILSDARYI